MTALLNHLFKTVNSGWGKLMVTNWKYMCAVFQLKIEKKGNAKKKRLVVFMSDHWKELKQEGHCTGELKIEKLYTCMHIYRSKYFPNYPRIYNRLKEQFSTYRHD